MISKGSGEKNYYYYCVQQNERVYRRRCFFCVFYVALQTRWITDFICEYTPILNARQKMCLIKYFDEKLSSEWFVQKSFNTLV